jgi:hypothetical protein
MISFFYDLGRNSRGRAFISLATGIKSVFPFVLGEDVHVHLWRLGLLKHHTDNEI